jgi:acyl-coenzyme A synthetase/AMP-(fatty) acid ligase
MKHMSAVIDTIAGPLRAHPASALAVGAPERAIAFDAQGPVSLARFLREVNGVAARLPAAAHAITLCEDRYRFLVAFCAAAARGQTTLLPSSRAPAVIEQVRAAHPGAYCIAEEAGDGATPPHHYLLPGTLPQAESVLPWIDDNALVAVGFTSGSTGQPLATPKRWGSFRTSTAQNLVALAGLLAEVPGVMTPLVATVPPQHMYGMEMSVLLPLLGPLTVHSARPFFPGDIVRALGDAAAPPLLVTSPVHLRTLLQSGVALPPLAGIVCSTAPLPPELARAAEVRYRCEVRELFGSTETCVIARRRTAMETAWTPLPGVRLLPQPDGTAVHAAHLARPVVLADLVELHPDDRFTLRGRHADQLEIAGKRASLGDLTRQLLALPGVVDGVVLQLDGHDDGGVRRIAALVVAPGLDEASILQALRGQCDPVFLPRRLRCVERLPRNDTGKLPRQALLDLLQG